MKNEKSLPEKISDDDLYSNAAFDDDLYAKELSLNKENNDDKPIEPPDTPQSKTFHNEKQLDEADNLDGEDFDTEKISPDKKSRTKTFHSKNFIDSETQAAEDKEKSSTHEPELKMKLSHAETSGVAISAVMLVYSLSEADKPLLFLSMALLIFLLRPLIGALFGKHNRAVQNALHSFSIVLFIGAMIMLFL